MRTMIVGILLAGVVGLGAALGTMWLQRVTSLGRTASSDGK